MGQSEVLYALAKKPHNWLSSKDIADVTGVGVSSVTMALKRLRKQGMVDWEMARTLQGIPYYVYKHKR